MSSSSHSNPVGNPGASFARASFTITKRPPSDEYPDQKYVAVLGFHDTDGHLVRTPPSLVATCEMPTSGYIAVNRIDEFDFTPTIDGESDAIGVFEAIKKLVEEQSQYLRTDDIETQCQRFKTLSTLPTAVEMFRDLYTAKADPEKLFLTHAEVQSEWRGLPDGWSNRLSTDEANAVRSYYAIERAKHLTCLTLIAETLVELPASEATATYLRDRDTISSHLTEVKNEADRRGEELMTNFGLPPSWYDLIRKSKKPEDRDDSDMYNAIADEHSEALFSSSPVLSRRSLEEGMFIEFDEDHSGEGE